MGLTQVLMARWSDATGIAIVAADEKISWPELDDRIRRAATWLEIHGVQAGDVVALQTDRSPLFLEMLLAAIGLGACALPVNDRYSPPEIRYLLEDSKAKLAVLTARAHPEFPDSFNESSLRAELSTCEPHPLALDPAEESPAFIAYTSGTTGRPKGAVLSHANVLATVRALHEAWHWSKEDVLLHALPLFHIHGLFVAQFGALYACARTLWAKEFQPDRILRTLEHERCTIFMGVPTFYHRFLQLPLEFHADLTPMRLFTCGSAALPAPTLEAFQQRFGHQILERYGMTEIGIAASNPFNGVRKAGSIGRPLPGVKAKIIEHGSECSPGEKGVLHIQGPGVFAGYLGRPDATATALVDGWMNTGDIAHQDTDGYIYLSGRTGEMLISGGFNVYPAEIEAVLLKHPAILEAAVIGVPDSDLGERPVASLVTTDAFTDVSLLELLKANLAPYKQPRYWRRVPQLPRNAMGKVLKDQLKNDWAKIHIRRATLADANRLITSNRAMGLETEQVVLDEHKSQQGVLQLLADPSLGTYYIAEINGMYVGQCMITKEWSDWRATQIWWIQSVYVPPEQRNKGVYRSLYAEMGALAEAEGAAGLRLYVDVRNERARAVYEKLGMNGEHYQMYERMFDR